MTITYLNTNLPLCVYEGCGNTLLMFPFAGNQDELRLLFENPQFRGQLQTLGLQAGADSIMVLTKSFSQAHSEYGMEVFEPRGSDHLGLPGSWSTMCGNGLRATAAYWYDLRGIERLSILTRSGERTVQRICNDQYQAEMGLFSTSISDFRKYVNSQNLALLPAFFKQDFTLGLTGTPDQKGIIDGEPHCILFVDSNKTQALSDIRHMATLLGPRITKATQFFPREINANFASVQEVNQEQKIIFVNLATHERGLGDDPQTSVTAACGTGATVVGATILRTTPGISSNWRVHVRMIGGTLEISQNQQGVFFMTGPAHKKQDIITASTIN